MKVKQQAGFAPLIVVLLIAVFGAIGAIGYKTYSDRSAVSVHVDEAKQTPKSEPKVPADWKTFSDESGVNFKYPGSWQQLPPIFPGIELTFLSNRDSYTATDPDVQFIMTGRTKGGSFDECYKLDQIKKGKIISSETVTFGGGNGRKLIIDPVDGKKQYGIAYITVKDGNCYHLVHASQSKEVRDSANDFFAIVARSYEFKQ